MSESRELLFEIGCEEIPSSFIIPALERMEELFKAFCGDARISIGEVTAFATPRRLTLKADAVSTSQEDVTIETKGPPARAAKDDSGAWTKTAEKFAASRGVAVDSLEIRSTEKGDYVFAVKEEKGGSTSDALKKLPETIVNALSFPKSMRWDVRTVRFARPVRWILLLFGNEPIDGGFDDIPSGSFTYGNRYYGFDKIEISSPAEYFEKLEKNGVMVDHRKRREEIRAKAMELSGGRPHMTDDLLEEVTFLVEYPYTGVGTFPKEFAELPPEVLIICIEKNQRYFPVFEKEGKKVAPRFVNVMNAPLTESAIVQKGYEKVLISRLKDAKFFFDSDVKTPLPERVPMLERITFQKKLGSIMDKVRRVAALAETIGDAAGCDAEQKSVCARAAELMKADLGTQMVFEYTEIQGTVGKYYALHAGEKESVATAIEEHYMPRFADDDLPATLPGSVLAIADKMDTIAGYFSIGKSPSGSADPFQLRRQALGVIRILEQSAISIKLEDLIRAALDRFDEKILPGDKKDSVFNDIFTFFKGRFSAYMESRGFQYDVVNAINIADMNSLGEVAGLAETLAAERNSDGFKGLHEVFTRISNIQKKSASDSDFQDKAADPARLVEQAEKDLHAAYAKIVDKWKSGDAGFKGQLDDLYTLSAPAHSFFENVMVMAEDQDVRANRLALLREIRALYLRVANFQEIVMQG